MKVKCMESDQETLGLSLLFRMDSMAFFECNGLRLLLSLPEKEAYAHSSSVVYFQVESIKEIYEKLTDEGVKFIDEPHVVANGNMDALFSRYIHERGFCLEHEKRLASGATERKESQ